MLESRARVLDGPASGEKGSKGGTASAWDGGVMESQLSLLAGGGREPLSIDLGPDLVCPNLRTTTTPKCAVVPRRARI